MKKFDPVRNDEGSRQTVEIPAGNVLLSGEWCVPQDIWATVLFVHGSGSSRYSPRNQSVARTLQAAGIATLLFDLLPEEETASPFGTSDLRFDIRLLTDRLVAATQWAARQSSEELVRLGYFGASTGAAAALMAAARPELRVEAIVSRGGRPDLAKEALRNVTAPTLLIAGGNDEPVVTLNRYAYDELTCEKRLEIIPGATHLFEQPGALENVANLAIDWFRTHLRDSGRSYS
jgi:putative phosphoribosyl transferase